MSIVIPAYNEEARLGSSLEKIRAAQPAAEVIVVDDGSRDRTIDVARRTAVRVIRQDRNRGKGFALRIGVLEAAGDRVLVTDADLSTPIEELSKLEASLAAGFEIAVGSRKAPGARVLRHQPWLRETLGKGFTFLSQLTLGVRVRDFTCGFKLFTRKCARDLFSRLTIDRWGFDAEILFLASTLGYRMAEIGVVWLNDEQTKVRLSSDVMQSLRELVQIRVNASLGRYGNRRRKER